MSVYAVGGFLNTNSSYSFLWDSGETESVLINKNAGLYTVVAEDDNSCKDSLNIEIPLIETFSLVLSSDSLNCYNDGSGMAHVEVSEVIHHIIISGIQIMMLQKLRPQLTITLF